MIETKFFRKTIFALSWGIAVAAFSSMLWGAESESVGCLALAVEEDVATQLQLTGEQKQKLMDLIDRRENDAIGLILESRSLPPNERAEKLAAFRKESETQGLVLLNPQQQAQLDKIRFRRMGMASLAEPAVVEKVGLSDEQKKQVAEILHERETGLVKADATRARIIRAETERKLAFVLDTKQKNAWESFTGSSKLVAEAAPPSVNPTREPVNAASVPAVSPAVTAVSPVEKASPKTPEKIQISEKTQVSEKASEKTVAPTSLPETTVIEKTIPEKTVPTEKTVVEKTVVEKTVAELKGTKEAEVDKAGEKVPDVVKAKEPSPSTVAGKEEPKKRPGKLQFRFQYTPWKNVLEWFAQQADLSLVMDAPPLGSFNYTDDREYTPAEAIDLLNSVLWTKGYALVRRERMLLLINKEANGIPSNFIQTITPEQLDDRGEFELLRVSFNLDKLSPEEAEQEIIKLLGPDGSVVTLAKSRQILVTDLGGRLKAVRALIRRVEDPLNVLSGQIHTIDLKQASPEQVLPIVKQMLDIPEDKNFTSDGSLRLAVDPSGNRIIATGKVEKIARLEEIVKAVTSGAPTGIAGSPQFESYPISSADPASVLAVAQTLLQGKPDVRLALDPKTGALNVLARPAEQAMVRALLSQMQRDARRVVSIRLRIVDPQAAVLMINKMFGVTNDPKTTSATAPQVDAEITTRQLLIRGTDAQVAQIRQMLTTMGEPENDGDLPANKNKVRMLTAQPHSARSALDQMQSIWPAAHKNQIREVTPSAVIPSLTPADNQKSSNIPERLLKRIQEEIPRGSGLERRSGTPRMATPDQPIDEGSGEEGATPEHPDLPPSMPPMPEHGDHGDRSDAHASLQTSTHESVPAPERRLEAKIWLVSDQLPAGEAGKSEAGIAVPEPTTPPPVVNPSVSKFADILEGKARAGTELPEKLKSEADLSASSQTGSPIIVSIGPGGVMIASEDTEALDEFERMFASLTGGASATPHMNIFYLKHAKAAVVAEILDQVLGGGTLQQSSSGGGGGLIGDLAGAAFGEAGGNLVGSLLGAGGGSIKPSGSIRITPDPRLNALVVQANPNDVEMIDQLLRILDRKESPEEILIAPKPRLIPILNTDAEKVAEVVKQAYPDRLLSSSNRGAQPTPQDFMQMLRGGNSRRGGAGGRQQTEEVQKMSIGVDTRTNSLIVAAPDPLFQEVKNLVDQIDVVSEDTSESLKTVVVRKASPEAIEAALRSIGGENVQFNRTSGTSSSFSRPGGMSSFGYGQGGSRRPGQSGSFNPYQGNRGSFNTGGSNRGSFNSGGSNRGSFNSGNNSGNRGSSNFGGSSGGNRSSGGRSSGGGRSSSGRGG